MVWGEWLGFPKKCHNVSIYIISRNWKKYESFQINKKDNKSLMNNKTSIDRFIVTIQKSQNSFL